MTRSELIADLAADNPHLRVADVELLVAAIFDHITAALARGDRVVLRRFGAFTVRRRGARIGRNPRTGETGKRKASQTCRFRVGDALKSQLNS